ncbi:MAG: dehydrogenase [Verrucomicrobia bacterium]|nr:MAG: dehydrogenase [Verrucomicrobiota bacterium]
MNPFALRAAIAISLVAPVAFAAQFKFSTQTFTVPDGFEVELVAGPPLVERPVSAGFDDQGRLYVTDSSGSNEKPDKQLANPPHRVVRLEDADGDGRFEKSVVFADKVMFPQGCLWYDGSLYVAGPPSIWKFTDTNGDGVADEREEWWKGGTLTGCANDVHGPYLGPDGYLYWTKGAFAEQSHILGNGRSLNDKAAHIYRARPDGSDLDVIMSGGMDNPVEVAFTAEGEAIFTSTFIDFSQPGFRDGIAHAVYGGVFGKQNDVLEDGRVKRTGPDLLHPFYEAGNAAECGLCRYESAVFGADYRDNFFATTFNLHKVTRHILRPSGATYASTDSDFVVSDSTDFHPTDVLEDADGSLLVVDTGGWYKLCCPSSQLAKPDVLGAIYRVRKHGAPKLPNSARRNEYARVIGPSLDIAKNWVALKQSAMQRESKAASVMQELLQETTATAATSNDSARAARIAAEGLGRLGYRPGVPALLHATGFTGDAILEHSLTFALIEIADATGTRAGLKDANPRTKRAALIALDQMDGSDLKPSDVIPFLNASDEHLRSAANWILGHHLEWGGELAGWFREQLGAPRSDSARREQLHTQLRILTRAEAGQQLLADVVRQPGFQSDTRVAALNAIADAGLKQPPAIWKQAVLTALETPDSHPSSSAGTKPADLETGPLLKAAVRAARGFNSDASIQSALLTLARETGLPTDLHLEALAGLPGGIALGAAEYDFLRANLAPAESPMTRTTAAGIIGRAKLSEDQLAGLTVTLKIAGPLEISKLLGAFDHVTSEAIGLRLIAALNESKGLSGLRVDLLKPLIEKFPATVQEKGQALLERLNADLVKQKVHLEELLASLPKGDIRRGQAIFNSPKTACASCHKIGYVGGLVGPDLTSIGQARTERDLLESVVYPSASFVRSYEPMVVATKSGDEYSGVVRRDAADEVLLTTGPNTEVRIARSDIAEMRPGTVSIMPQGLDEQLSRQELADLLAFLKGTKWGAQ